MTTKAEYHEKFSEALRIAEDRERTMGYRSLHVALAQLYLHLYERSI